MSERDTRTNQELRIPTLGGLNERPSPANLRPGEFSHLEGLYPAQIGLLRRIPGKTFLASVTGRVLQIYATGNTNGDVLIQTDAPALYAFTLDELLDRASTPSLIYPSTPDEDAMSMAIIVQKEANAVNGGSMSGFISGADSTSALNTFYARRLTNMLLNETGSFGDTVASFTAASGGAGAVSTGSQITLGVGDYRISAHICFAHAGTSTDIAFVAGLYNMTDAAFEVHRGSAVPIIANIATLFPATASDNMMAVLEAAFSVAGSNKIFELRQACNQSTPARNTIAGGRYSSVGGTAIAGAAITPFYTFIRLIRTA